MTPTPVTGLGLHRVGAAVDIVCVNHNLTPRPGCRRAESSQGGFTLIELLVVVSHRGVARGDRDPGVLAAT